jgi:hypothetical protein
VGTTISCIATPAPAGQFKLELVVGDSSVYDDTAKPPTGPQPLSPAANPLPALRSFSSSNTLTLKDGQSSQFTTATDRITGEVTKADVTLTVAK